MRPCVGLRNLVSRLKQVVLPAPLGPINAWIVPRSTRRLTSRTATKPANSLVRPSVSRTMSLAIERANSPAARLCRKLCGKGPGAGMPSRPLPSAPAFVLRLPAQSQTLSSRRAAARTDRRARDAARTKDASRAYRRPRSARSAPRPMWLASGGLSLGRSGGGSGSKRRARRGGARSDHRAASLPDPMKAGHGGPTGASAPHGRAGTAVLVLGRRRIADTAGSLRQARGERDALALLSYGCSAQEVAAAGMVRFEPDDGPGARCGGAPGQESRSQARHPLPRRLQPGRQDDLHRPPHAAVAALPRTGHRHRSLPDPARGSRENPDRPAQPALPPCAPDRDARRAGRRARGRNRMARLRPVHAEIRQGDRRRAADPGAGRSRRETLSRRARYRPAGADERRDREKPGAQEHRQGATAAGGRPSQGPHRAKADDKGRTTEGGK